MSPTDNFRLVTLSVGDIKFLPGLRPRLRFKPKPRTKHRPKSRLKPKPRLRPKPW